MADQAHPYNADLSKESEHAAEFQIHIRHSREEKAGHCHGFLSGSYCKEIKELFTLAWPTVFRRRRTTSRRFKCVFQKWA